MKNAMIRTAMMRWVPVASILLLASLQIQESQARTSETDVWESYLPGQYDAKDSKTLNDFSAKLAKISATAGKVDVPAVVSGKLDNQKNPSVSWNPMENNYRITRENMLKQAHMYLGDNPLFTDESYATKSPLQGLTAFSMLYTNECMPAIPKREGIGDYFVVSSHNDTTTYYRPIHEGDTLYTVYTAQNMNDITPTSGSRFRTFALSGSCKVYNQRGELVAEGANILKESFRRHSDPAQRNPDQAHAWESPDWWQLKPHQYTDKDWQTIITSWKSEKRRGDKPLYWEDVKPGQQLASVYTPPLLSDQETDQLFEVPGFAVQIKQDVLDPNTFPRMVKNPQGIYVRPENLNKKTAEKPFSGAGRDTDDNARTGKATPEIANRDGRATLQNAVLPKFVAGSIYSWMGDHGWLQRIGWDIMTDDVPGYPESAIPHIPRSLFPPQFDKFPVLAKVPGKAKTPMKWHALEGDIYVIQSYVTNTYQKDGAHFADLTWWIETMDKVMVERGFVTVKLPSRQQHH